MSPKPRRQLQAKTGSVKFDFQEGLGEETKLSFSELNQALQATELEAALEFDVLSLLVYPGQKLASLTPPTEGNRPSTFAVPNNLNLAQRRSCRAEKT